jgi:hypothetical protein
MQGAVVLQIPGIELAHVRSKLGVRGNELARTMGMKESTLSRFQQRDSVPEQEAERYLRACGFDETDRFLNYYRAPWTLLDIVAPSWAHPDREVLCDIVRGIERLDNFSASAACDELLSPSVRRLRERLVRAGQYLASRDHTLAFLGDAGRGKTTTITRLAGLWHEGKPCLPVGGGLTTICEMVLRAGQQAAVDVIPHDDGDVEEWVRHWVQGMAIADADPVTPEIERALRSMSDLRMRRPKGADGRRVSEDPLDELRSVYSDLNELTEEVMRRIDLPARRTRSLLCPEGEDGLKWLQDVIGRINSGRHRDISLPKVATITVPVPIAPESVPYRITMVDTKGIDGTPQREDLMLRVEDRRTLSILCSGFTTPDGNILRLLRQEREAGLGAARQDRIVLLMLAKNNEATEVLDGAEPAETTEEGYLIKGEQVRRVLDNEGLTDIEPLCFNVLSEQSDQLWGMLQARVRAMRGHSSDTAKAALAQLHRLEHEADRVRVEEGLAEIVQQFEHVLAEVTNLPSTRRHPKTNLLEEMKYTNAATLAASMRRQGRYSGFSVPFVMATGYRTIANERSEEPSQQVATVLNGLAEQFHDVEPVRAAVDVLREEAETARQDFLGQVHDYAKRLFESYFEEDADTAKWQRIKGEYGKGAGYKGRVSARFDEWFENDQELTELVEEAHRHTAALWFRSVVGHLRATLDTTAKFNEESFAA